MMLRRQWRGVKTFAFQLLIKPFVTALVDDVDVEGSPCKVEVSSLKKMSGGNCSNFMVASHDTRHVQVKSDICQFNSGLRC